MLYVCISPLNENVTAVDTKGPIIRFIEQLKLFI